MKDQLINLFSAMNIYNVTMQHTIFLFEESNDLNYMFAILINESKIDF